MRSFVEKGIHFTRVPIYKRLPCIIDFPLQVIPPYIYEGFPLQREINYIRKPLIYGNSCKVNALFNKGAHPRPSLFEESSVHLNISNTIGKTKETKTTKEVKATTIKNHRENQTKQKQQNFQTHVGQSGHGSESFVFFVFFGFPDGF